MKISILAFSEKSFFLGERLAEYFASNSGDVGVTRCKDGSLGAWTEAHFALDDALIFVGSAGIAVRAIAPHVKSKITDPAVIVVDELGTYSISLLSGHLGGANELAVEIARFLGAIPVITTASDLNNVFAVDTWAKQQGLVIANPERIKWVSSRLLAGEIVKLKSRFPIEGKPPESVELTDGPSDILVTYRTRGKAEALRLVPPVVTLGIGCKKGMDVESIEIAFSMMLTKANCHIAAVKRVCSIDLKANETGILEFCRRHALPFCTFSASALADVPGKFSSSAFVKSATGVDNVCERSAVLGSGKNGRLLTKKDAEHGITMALAIEPYVVRFCEGGKAE
jgi:cobalt-precorrin 5A hydrolase